MSTSVIDRDMLMDRLQRNSDQIKSYGVKRLGLFGSFLRNTVTRESDVDLLVEFERGKKASIISWTLVVTSKSY